MMMILALVSTMAATAWYHKKIPNKTIALKPFLAEAEKFALGEYMTALLQGSELSEAQLKATAEKLHTFIGLPVDYLIKAELRVQLRKEGGAAGCPPAKTDGGASCGRTGAG